MSAFLLKLLELSLQAGALTVAILLVRLVFKRLPAKYLCILWMIVAARLMIPFSFESSFAPMRSLETFLVSEESVVVKRQWYPAADTNDETDYYLHDTQQSSGEGEIYGELIEEWVTTVVPGTDADDETDYYLVSVSTTPVPEGIANTVFNLDWRALFASVTPVLFGLWLLGMVLLLGYGAFSCSKVKRLVKNAIPYEDNVWLCEGIKTPFLFGWTHPQIYLPTNLEEPQLQYVILHERAHIARGDNYTKIIGYVLLAVYWFNPLLWVAYVMFCKGVERACDERVIGGFSAEDRKGYAEALLSCSVDQHFAISNPLAFGEADVKNRIVGILKYRKPGKVLAMVALLLCVAAVAGCFVVKKEDGENINRPEVTPTVAADATPTNPPRGDGPYTPTPIEPTPTLSLAIPTPAEYVWTQTITHIPSDLERTQSDWDLIGEIATDALATVPVGQTVTVDLNGDGIEESVTYDVENLYINEEAVLKCGEELFGIDDPYDKSYYIFDIDLADGYKEIGLREMGPNGDEGIYLYRYEEGQLQPIGGFRNVPQNGEEMSISVPGDGTVWTVDRDFLLETCSVVKKYQLENAASGLEARLTQARRGHYVFLHWDSENGIPTTTTREFKAFSSDGMHDEAVVIVPEGSEITFCEYYLSHEDWGRGFVKFFYTVEEKWDSVGWLWLTRDGITMPRNSDTEPFETVEPEELFLNLNMAG